MAIKDNLKAVLTTSMTNFATEAYARFAKLGDFNTLNGKVTTLIGSDTGKSVRGIANEELAAQLIPANAKEALDTLQEIAAWIQDHPDEAAAINAKLELGTYDDNGTAKQYATVKAYVEAYVASQIGDAALSGSTSIDITSGVISLIVDTANANGLTIGANGVSMGLASASSNGALSSSDWSTFNAKQEQIVVPTASGTGNVVTSVALNADGKTIDLQMGLTALTESDFEALTAAECTTIFNNALTAASGSGE